MGIKTYPEGPDVLSESLTPVEGVWLAPFGTLVLSDFREVGNSSIYNQIEYVPAKPMFRFHDGREFDGTRQNATLHMRVASQGVAFPSPGWIILHDASGRKAWKRANWNFDQSYHGYSWLLSSATDWTVDEGFDWRFIKAFQLEIDGNVWVDEPYFSYYELEFGRLTVLSEPPEKQFRINGTFYTTPTYNLGLLPHTDYEVAIQPVDFKQWEDGNIVPTRTINLAEAEEKTIIAYYEGAAPPPGKGKLHCVAYANGAQVEARVEIAGVGTYYTPFEVDLDPGSYSLTAYYKDQTDSVTAEIVEEFTTPVAFHFTAPPGPPGFPWGLAAGITILIVGGAIIVIYPEELKQLIGW